MLEADGRVTLCYARAAITPRHPCDVPEVVGWDWDDIGGEKSAGGVTWGCAVLTGTWDGERFTLTAPPAPLPDGVSMFDWVSARRPAVCDTAATARPVAETARIPLINEVFEALSTVSRPTGEIDTDAPFGRLDSVGFDHDCGVVVAEVLVADARARAYVQELWGDRVQLLGQLQPVVR